MNEIRGHGQKNLIVNADDFGMTKGISQGIMEAHENGIVTSTSLMVFEPASAYAAALAKGRASLSIGLHGVLQHPSGERLGLGEYFIDSLERQLEEFIRLVGMAPTHFDTHAVPAPSSISTFAAYAFAKKHRLAFRGTQKNIHRFYGMKGTTPVPKNITVEALVKILANVSYGVNLLICHPGRTSGRLTDPYKMQRVVELHTLTSPIIHSLINIGGIELVNFRNWR